MTASAQAPKRKRYSTAKQVCDRYGGRSDMWLWRILKNDPRFPRPMTPGHGKLRLFDDDELDHYDQQQKEKYYDVA